MHRSKTASGAIFNSNGLTAAHKTLPFGTVVLITNLNNGKSVKVVINDRGPYIKNRIIDVSKKAAIILDFVKHGTTDVKIEIIN